MVHSKGAVLSWGTFVCVWLLAAGWLVGCAAQRTPPLPPPEGIPSRDTEDPSTHVSSLTEEILAPDSSVPEKEPNVPSVGSENPPPQEDPESLLTMIQPSSPPHVAAATQLVEAARTEIAAGQTEAALEHLEQAIAIDANNPFAYYFLAECYLARGIYEQAVAFADKAALLSASLDSNWQSRSYCLEGRIFEAAGRFADARAAYNKALEADAHNRAAWEGLVRLGGLLPAELP